MDTFTPSDVARPLLFAEPMVSGSVMRRGADGLSDVLEVLTSGNCYAILRVLKDTIYGHVHLAVKVVQNEAGGYAHAEPPTFYAIKVSLHEHLEKNRERTQENPLQEIAAMQHIGNSHPNIMVQIESCCHEGNLYSIMDFVDGSELLDVVNLHGPLNEETAKHVFGQIVRGMQHIHGKGLAHRDMSLENVMCTRQGDVRIIDFGMSLLLPRRSDGTVIPIEPQGACGKPAYVAPEVIANEQPFNPQHADLWALGVMLFAMLAGVYPMEVASSFNTGYRMVRSGRLRDILQRRNVSLSPEAVDLLEQILQTDPAQRLPLDGMLAHPWLLDEPLKHADVAPPAVAKPPAYAEVVRLQVRDVCDGSCSLPLWLTSHTHRSPRPPRHADRAAGALK